MMMWFKNSCRSPDREKENSQTLCLFLSTKLSLATIHGLKKLTDITKIGRVLDNLWIT
jgi:hypothetical protein